VPTKYRVTLSPEERETLESLIASGIAPARTLTHARILLKADESEGRPVWRNAAIAEMLEITEPTISRVRKRFREAGLEAALHRKHPERRWERKLDGAQEAHLIALACSEAPEGRDRWSLRLLAEKMVELGHVEEVSYETIRRTLKRGGSNLG
jgi:transposase